MLTGPFTVDIRTTTGALAGPSRTFLLPSLSHVRFSLLHASQWNGLVPSPPGGPSAVTRPASVLIRMALSTCCASAAVSPPAVLHATTEITSRSQPSTATPPLRGGRSASLPPAATAVLSSCARAVG